MSLTTVKVLEAAAEILGGTRELADHLGISEGLLSRFMADRRVLPDLLLLRAVDVIIADRDGGPPVASELSLQTVQKSTYDD